jgi:hypothetical protein
LSSPEAWPLQVSGLVPNRSVPLAICICVADDGGTYFVCSPLFYPCGDLPLFNPRPPFSNILLNAGVGVALMMVKFELPYFSCALPSHSIYLRHSARFHSFSGPTSQCAVSLPFGPRSWLPLLCYNPCLLVQRTN